MLADFIAISSMMHSEKIISYFRRLLNLKNLLLVFGLYNHGKSKCSAVGCGTVDKAFSIFHRICFTGIAKPQVPLFKYEFGLTSLVYFC